MAASLLAALLVAFTPVPTSAAGATTAVTHRGWRLLRLPLFSFHRHAVPSESAARPHEQILESSHGWRTLGFVAPAAASGCFLRIEGRAEFDRAEVLFADGQLEPIELRGARRGRGLYELVRWPQARAIACVRLRARAHSAEARVELVLGE